MIGPPPRPWKIRAATNVVRSGAAPETKELTTKRVEQIRKNRRRPKRPVSQPVAGMTTALAARYDVITQETSSSPADIDPCRCGRMTLVTLVSRICMKATTMTVKVMAHFRAAEISGSADGVVTRGSRRGSGRRASYRRSFHGVEVKRKKRLAFSHMSLCMAG